jgi:hypothetical protein
VGQRRIRVLIFAFAILVTTASSMVAQVGREKRTSGFRHSEPRDVEHLKDATKAECMHCHAEQRRVGGVLTLVNLDNCDDCHTQQKSIKVTKGTRQVTKPFRGFDHDQHQQLDCDHCHTYDRRTDEFSLPKNVLVNLCANCHDDHNSELPAFSGNCAKCHVDPIIKRMSPDREGKFNHQQHLPTDRVATRDDCLACHTGVAGSVDIRNGDLGGVRAEACGRCHIPKAGQAANKVAPRKIAKKRFFTEFDHQAHTKTFDCAECHQLRPDGMYDFTIPELPKYEGCVSCHYHNKPQWKVADHGKPIQCGRCHEETGNGAIRTETYQKRGLGNITFGVVAHPFVSDPEALAGDADDCGECHIRARLDMPSRIKAAPFSHKAHWGIDIAEDVERGRFPKLDVCYQCHEALKKAPSPAESHAFNIDQDCAKCHKGEGATVEAPAAQEVTRAPFSHESHLAARNRRIEGCESCHEYDPKKDLMTTADDVLSCTRCHDHDGNKDVTGYDVTGQNLDKCTLCHKGDSLWRQGTVVEVEYDRLAGVTFASQQHDMGGRCEECHAPPGGFQVEVPTITEVVHQNKTHVKASGCGDCHLDKKDGREKNR